MRPPFPQQPDDLAPFGQQLYHLHQELIGCAAGIRGSHRHARRCCMCR